jgi:large subunit ribosomal protein L17
VLRIEPKEKVEYYSVRKGDKFAEKERKPADQAPSAILELVDGPKDMRFAMTARAVSRQRELDWDMNEITERNIRKVTQFRKGGIEALEAAVGELSLSKSKVLDVEEKEVDDLEPPTEEEEKKAAELAEKVDALRNKA